MVVGRIDILQQSLRVQQHAHRLLMGKGKGALLLYDLMELANLLIDLHVPALCGNPNDGDGRVVVLEKFFRGRDVLADCLQTGNDILQLLDLMDRVSVVVEQLCGGHLQIPLLIVDGILGRV